MVPFVNEGTSHFVVRRYPVAKLTWLVPKLYWSLMIEIKTKKVGAMKVFWFFPPFSRKQYNSFSVEMPFLLLHQYSRMGKFKQLGNGVEFRQLPHSHVVYYRAFTMSIPVSFCNNTT